MKPPTSSESAQFRHRRLQRAMFAAGALLWSVQLTRAQVVDPNHANDAKPLEIPDTWLDHTQQSLHRLVWRSAMTLDSIAGGRPDSSEPYLKASGSIAFAVLWNEFDGVEPRVRFRVDLPLPQINHRFHAFVGRVDRDEFVAEQNEPSGALPRYRTSSEDDQTLAGIAYVEPSGDRRGRFSAGAGARLRSSFVDPYIKAAYSYQRLIREDLRLRIKETLFWQRSEQLGLTSRIDLEKIIADHWHLRWTASGTIAQRTDSVRGYTTFTITRALPARRAVILQFEVEGDSDADVPLEDFGVKLGYRRSIFRDWLVLEMRTSLSWPKEFRSQPRKPSWGLGIGCEMYFGEEPFSTQPVTF